MKETTVILGGRSYVVPALPIGKSKQWREDLAVPFTDLAKALNTVANFKQIDSFSDVATLVDQMRDVLLGSVDLMLELLYSYAPIIAADKDWIEANAYDEEALDAFTEVLKLAYPFGALLGVVTGRMAIKTSSSLPSQNGVLPLPASGPKRKEKK